MVNILVSVIIPVYNCERFLPQCIDSLLKQSYHALEIILVDDGATDGSSAICDLFAQKSPTIKVIHRENGGAATARKNGLAQASGQYILFVDADDWVEETYVENLITLATEWQADVVAGTYQIFKGHTYTKHRSCCSQGFYNKAQCEQDIYPRMLSSAPFYSFGVSPSMCGKLFRSDIAKKNMDTLDTGISFGEDGCFTYSALLDCDSIYITDQSGYIYRQNSMSATHSFNERLLLDGEKLKSFLNNLATRKNWKANTQIDEYMAYVCNYTVTSALRAGYANTKEAKKRINRYIQDIFPTHFLCNKHFQQCSLKTKIRYVLIRYGMLSILLKFIS